MDDKNAMKVPDIYCCKNCDYNTSRKSQYERHLMTPKHQKSYTEDKKSSDAEYTCECGKKYKYRQGLWKHNKICKFIKNKISDEKENTCLKLKYSGEETDNQFKILTNMVMDVVKHNQELSNQNMKLTNTIMDICKNTTNITNNTINSNNKTFNLNVFLNEECKDAMNITDFVDSLELKLIDLETVGQLGFVEGISNIIVKNLKAMDIHKRPVHCSDSKREVIYIKDENKWEKENEEKKKIRKMIKNIANKNVRLITSFTKTHPDCINSKSKYSDQFNKLVVEAMGGTGDNDLEKEDKIIKKIAKEVTITK